MIWVRLFFVIWTSKKDVYSSKLDVEVTLNFDVPETCNIGTNNYDRSTSLLRHLDVKEGRLSVQIGRDMNVIRTWILTSIGRPSETFTIPVFKWVLPSRPIWVDIVPLRRPKVAEKTYYTKFLMRIIPFLRRLKGTISPQIGHNNNLHLNTGIVHVPRRRPMDVNPETTKSKPIALLLRPLKTCFIVVDRIHFLTSQVYFGHCRDDLRRTMKSWHETLEASVVHLVQGKAPQPGVFWSHCIWK